MAEVKGQKAEVRWQIFLSSVIARNLFNRIRANPRIFHSHKGTEVLENVTALY